MAKDLGRLDLRDVKNYESQLAKVYKFLDDNDLSQAESTLKKLISTPNYYVREFIGKKLTDYYNSKLLDKIIKKLEGDKVYGVRATLVFYFYYKHQDDPVKVLKYLEKYWSNTPWEIEQIVYELWQNYPDLMKVEMLKWAESEHVKKRSFAYHGLESIAAFDVQYILNIVEKNIDTDDEEMSKRIVNVLSHTAKASPAECYSYIHEWLTHHTDNRASTLFVAMKKMITIACYNYTNFKTPKTEEFYLLTLQAIQDWKNDSNPKISNMGERLVYFSKSPHLYEASNSAK